MSNKKKTSQSRKQRVYKNKARKHLAKRIREVLYENHKQARLTSESSNGTDVPDETTP